MTTRHTTSNAAASKPVPRGIHAAILLATSSLSVLVTAILGPSLPLMQARFADSPHANYLVPLVVTVPMLVMALLCIWMGLLADRVGRKRLLVASTALYAVFGTAPLYLDSLGAILASRVALGVTEAILMTVSTTMIGDYFSGKQRERYMSLVVTLSATSAFVLNNVGGLLAQHGWRAPYLVYAFSLPLAVLMAVYLWEPTAKSSTGQVLAQRDETPFRPRLFAGLCAISVGVGITFLIVPIHFGYLFNAVGVTAPARIGLAYGINSLGLIVGSLVFGWWMAARLNVAFQLALSAAVAALGFLMMKSADTQWTLTLAGAINGLGCGAMLPATVTWSMRSLPFAKRGVGTGASQSAQFFGMFASPLIVVGMQEALGQSRAGTVGGAGLVLLALAAVAMLVGLRLRFGTAKAPVRVPLRHR